MYMRAFLIALEKVLKKIMLTLVFNFTCQGDLNLCTWA